jgi:hypothetical protein
LFRLALTNRILCRSLAASTTTAEQAQSAPVHTTMLAKMTGFLSPRDCQSDVSTVSAAPRQPGEQAEVRIEVMKMMLMMMTMMMVMGMTMNSKKKMEMKMARVSKRHPTHQ